MTNTAKVSHAASRKFRSKRPQELWSLLNGPIKFTDADLCHCVSLLLEGLDTPTSLGLHLCIKYGDLASAVSHNVNPCDYLVTEAFQRDWQACKIISKLNIRILGLDPEGCARANFLACEDQCRSENEFWSSYDTGKCDLVPEFEKILFRAKEIIADVISDGPDLEDWLNYSRLGPGVVAFGPKSTSDYVKLASSIGVTDRLRPYALSILDCYPGWIDGLSFGESTSFEIDIVNGGKYVQVSKNAKTNRNIETQPLLNGFLQLGLGQLLRRKLSISGINLNDQSRNQSLAKRGSIDGKLSTIDLSNASDTISIGAVAALLPPRWYHALQITRTENILFESKWVPLHRFSSMGNGYTFELESLIFYAITRAVCGSNATISVYGDDIIAPSTKFRAVCEALKFFGFSVNEDKSYYTGAFRESCGKDYFNGVLVRPFFIKEVPSNVPEAIRLANGLRRSASRHNRGYGYSGRFKSAIEFVYSRIPVRLRDAIAVGNPEDDSYLLGNTTKGGFRISFRGKTVAPSMWYAAKTCALYRIHKRSVNRTETDETVGTQSMLTLPVNSGSYVLIPFDVHVSERTWPQPEDPRLPGLDEFI